MRQKSQEFVNSSTTKNERIVGERISCFLFCVFFHFQSRLSSFLAVYSKAFAHKTCCTEETWEHLAQRDSQTTRHEKTQPQERKKKKKKTQ